jgi:hypothetical protein
MLCGNYSNCKALQLPSREITNITVKNPVQVKVLGQFKSHFSLILLGQNFANITLHCFRNVINVLGLDYCLP